MRLPETGLPTVPIGSRAVLETGLGHFLPHALQRVKGAEGQTGFADYIYIYGDVHNITEFSRYFRMIG